MRIAEPALVRWNIFEPLRRIACACVLAWGATPGISVAAADAYPAKPVRLIAPYAPGGNADIQARYIAERLSETLGKQFVVDNRAGANGMIGIELAARSPADGYTLLLVANTFTVNPSLFPKVPYDTVKDLQPITLVGDTPLLFVGNSAGRREQRERGRRAREKPARAAQLRLVRQRLAFAPGGRAARDDGRHQARARAVQRDGGGEHRRHHRPGTARVSEHDVGASARQSRES